MGVLFALKITFLAIILIYSMLHLKKIQIWVLWVITKILMYHMPSFEEKKSDQESPKQQNYHKNWHYYGIEKFLCPPCATVGTHLGQFRAHLGHMQSTSGQMYITSGHIWGTSRAHFTFLTCNVPLIGFHNLKFRETFKKMKNKKCGFFPH